MPVLRNEWREPLRAQRDPVTEDSGRVRSNREDRQRWRKRTWLGRFVSTYGWRAYALPVLTAVTVLAIYQMVNGTSGAEDTSSQSPLDGPRQSLEAIGTAIIGAPPKGLTQFDVNLPTGVLPDGGPFTEVGAKTWHIVPGNEQQVGQGTTKVFTYTVEIEDGVDTTAYGGDEGFARMVTQTLANPKSWTHNPQFGFRRVDAGKPDFRISLVTPMTTREACGYEIPIETSCYNPSYGPSGESRVVINEARWVRGAVPFQGDIGSYRQYLVNHEVGHAIGYQRHEPCSDSGALAPVMMEQTFGLDNNAAAMYDPTSIKPDSKVCRFNPWPYPIA